MEVFDIYLLPIFDIYLFQIIDFSIHFFCPAFSVSFIEVRFYGLFISLLPFHINGINGTARVFIIYSIFFPDAVNFIKRFGIVFWN